MTQPHGTTPGEQDAPRTSELRSAKTAVHSLSAMRSERITSLDGLRGLAALIVVIHHSLLVVPALAAPYFGGGSVALDRPLLFALIESPLHLIWAGGEAVYVFFVLSGFVLVLPALRGGFSWRAYYPSRALRLYLPVWAAVGFGYAMAFWIPRVAQPGQSAWLDASRDNLTVSGAVKDITLVPGISWVITPLWSLQWEAIFSILLPIFVLFVVTRRTLLIAKIVLVAAVSVVGVVVGQGILLYLPVFAVGALMASELIRLRELANSLDAVRRSRWLWGAMLAAAGALLLSPWILFAVNADSRQIELAKPLLIPGAALVVFIAAFHPFSRRVLDTRAFQFLGTISFSLYLVHEPIVVAIGFAVGPENSAWVLPLVLAISIPVSFGFYLLVERPAHGLARRVGLRLRKQPVQSAG